MNCKDRHLQSITEQIRTNRNNMRLKLKTSIKSICLKQEDLMKDKEANSIKKRRIRKSSQNSQSFGFVSLKDKSIKEQFGDYYQMLQKIGEGGHSVVYQCRNILDGCSYAVKFMRKNDQQSLERLKQQYKILQTLNHDSIIKGYFLFLNEKQLTCHLVCEFCDYPDLRAYIHKRSNKNNSEDEVAEIIQRILVAVQYLHEKGVCHRDLKPDNILFDELSGMIKIIDFEIGKMVKYKNQKLQMWTRTGTPHYRAPQSFLGGYNQAVDSWSLGVVAYQLLAGKLPFSNCYEAQLIKSICQHEPEIDSLSISDHAKMFLKRLLQKDPKSRMTAKQGLSHPFILTHITGSITSPNSKLNRSFDEQQQRQWDWGNQACKFYDQKQNLTFSETIDRDIGIRFCGEQQF